MASSFRPAALARDSAGFTLVELMITSALFGILSVAIGSMLAQHTKRVIRAQNAAMVAEQLAEFSLTLENYISNATFVFKSQASAVAPANQYTAIPAAGGGGDCLMGGCPNPVLMFQSEDSASPMVTPTGNCLSPNNAPVPSSVAPGGLVLLGCKHQYSLSFTPPTADGKNPGILALTEFTSGKTISQLTGVYGFVAGYVASEAAGTLNKNQYRFEIHMKARATNVAPGDPEFDGWYPGSQNFGNGYHRDLVTDVNLRNIATRGVYFAKAYAEANCDRDGQVSVMGICCSGYYDASSKTCLAMADGTSAAAGCTQAGDTPTGGNLSCCSHKLLGAVCL
jgi:prepilin-type N-terminal cleavage/methylation domain-containing protein